MVAAIQARHGIREVLRAAGRVDVIHLRMADVGSLVAAEVAAELGIPVVLTPPPIPRRSSPPERPTGAWTRAEFGDADRVEHLWFRDRLLRALAAQAEHLVLFPRPDVERSIGRLVGIDVTAQRERVSVVGEGIDLAALERVAKEVSDAPRSPETASALRELSAVLDQLPPNRRGLPLAVSVGRLSPVKGMATLASTWLTYPPCGNAATSSSSVVTWTTRRPRRPPNSPRIREVVPNRRLRRRGAAPRRPPPERHCHRVGSQPPTGASPGCVRARRGLRLRQPQGGVRHRDPRGDDDGPGRRGPEQRGGRRPTSRTASRVSSPTRPTHDGSRTRSAVPSSSPRHRVRRCGPAAHGQGSASGSASTRWPRPCSRCMPRWRRASRDVAAEGGHVMTLLVISPDYASHLYPLATLATALAGRG